MKAYILILVTTIPAYLFAQSDTSSFYYRDRIYVFTCTDADQLIEAVEFLIEEDRKEAAETMLEKVRPFLQDTSITIMPDYIRLTEEVNKLKYRSMSAEFLYADSNMPKQVIFINPCTGVYNLTMSSTQNAIKYGDSYQSAQSTVSSLTAGDYLIRAGNNKNRAVIFGVVGVSVSTLLFAIYANNSTDALLYLAAGTGAIGLTTSFAFNIKGNKDLKRAGAVINGF